MRKIMIKAKNHVCPRCGNSVPNSSAKGKYPGALSRHSNHEICSYCGMDEAIRQFLDMKPLPQNEWFVNQAKVS
jgi:ribosomal protein S27AE